MRFLLLATLFVSSSVLAQVSVPVSWGPCRLDQQVPAGIRLAKIYNDKIESLEVEKEMECRITRWGEIGAWARCTKNGEKFARVRMDVHFYCNSPKTRLAKTVITYL